MVFFHFLIIFVVVVFVVFVVVVIVLFCCFLLFFVVVVIVVGVVVVIVLTVTRIIKCARGHRTGSQSLFSRGLPLTVYTASATPTNRLAVYTVVFLACTRCVLTAAAVRNYAVCTTRANNCNQVVEIMALPNGIIVKTLHTR